MGKIFIYAYPANPRKPIDLNPVDSTAGIEHWNGDCIGEAIAEDGAGLAQHLSSGYGWFRSDMGLDGNRKHDAYLEHYPEGFELIEVKPEEQAAHLGLIAAKRLNKETRGRGKVA